MFLRDIWPENGLIRQTVRGGGEGARAATAGHSAATAETHRPNPPPINTPQVAAVNTPTKYRETYERIFSKNKGKGIVQRIVSPVRHILRLLRLPGGEKTKTGGYCA